MKAGRFDLREFQRVLFNSQTYQLAANISPDLEKGPYLFPGPLVRRLVESGVRFVEVSSRRWDMHKQLADSMENRGGDFDRAFAALVSDLDSRGIPDSTLVAVTTEFRRKPQFDGGGRGHHPLAFSTVLTGGGMKRGYTHGKSDDRGYEPEEKPMSVGNKGKPAMDVFA